MSTDGDWERNIMDKFEFATKESALGAIERKISEGWSLYRGSADLTMDFCDLLGHGIHFVVSKNNEGSYYATIHFSDCL